MSDEIQGYLYKRKAIGEPGHKKQVRLDPEDPIEGRFYIQWDIGGHRCVKCLHTSNFATAKQRWADMKANMMFVSDEEKYLQRLIDSKEHDIRKLQKVQSRNLNEEGDMKDKELKNIKISAEAHAKVSELSKEIFGASRERIMELAVDRLYDFVQKEGVGALFPSARKT
jgi:hypothetical protein